MGIFSYVKLGKKIFGKQKTTGKTTNPFERKKMRSDRAAMRDRAKNKFNVGGIAKRKSNIQKIQEAFGTAKKKDKNKKNKQIRMMAKKGSPDPKKKKKFPDLTGDGKVTFADILKGRGVINGKKKKTKKKII